MSIFDKNSSGIYRKDLRKILKDTPDPSRRNMSPQERMGMEKKFSKSFGSAVNDKEFSKTLLQMKRERFNAKDTDDKIKISRDIKYFEELKKRK